MLFRYFNRACARVEHWKLEAIQDVFRVKNCSLRYDKDNGDKTMRFVDLSQLEQLDSLDYE